MSGNELLFSIIIPIFNSKAFIEDCLNSIFAQTYQNYELILVDDGSTDGSIELVQRLISCKQHCRLVLNEHGGVCTARNTGLELASGDYICFVDSDDLVFPDYLSSLAEAGSRYDSDVLYFYAKYGVNSAPRKEYCGDVFEILNQNDIQFLASAAICHTPEIDIPGSRFYGISSFSSWGQAYRADLFREHNIKYIPGIVISEDGLLNLEILYYVQSAVIVRKELYNYRTENVSAIRSYKPYLLDSFEIRNVHVKNLIHTLYHDEPMFWEHYYCGLIYQLRAICEDSIFHRKSGLSSNEKETRFYEVINLPDYAKAITVCENAYLPDRNRVFLQAAKARNPSAAEKATKQQHHTVRLKKTVKHILRKLNLR